MTFGYDMLNGRQGASGYCRKAGEKTEIHARGLKVGESCVLYELLPDGAEKRDEQTADANGQTVFSFAGGNAVFVTAGGKVRLWQGGEENYLRACEWIQREKMKKEKIKKEETLKSISPETTIEPLAAETEESISEDPEAAENILRRELEEIQIPIHAEEKKEQAQLKTEENQTTTNTEENDEGEKHLEEEQTPTYTLRSPGAGEPVDALPD